LIATVPALLLRPTRQTCCLFDTGKQGGPVAMRTAAVATRQPAEVTFVQRWLGGQPAFTGGTTGQQMIDEDADAPAVHQQMMVSPDDMNLRAALTGITQRKQHHAHQRRPPKVELLSLILASC